jgi:hypothetical protein
MILLTGWHGSFLVLWMVNGCFGSQWLLKKLNVSYIWTSMVATGVNGCNPWQGQFQPKVFNLNKYSSGLLDNVSLDIYKLLPCMINFFKFFHIMIMQNHALWVRGQYLPQSYNFNKLSSGPWDKLYSQYI